MTAVVADVQSRFSAATTSAVGDYPASIGSSNEYLEMTVSWNTDTVSISSGTSGWTLLETATNNDPDLVVAVYVKAAASESGTITLTMSGSTSTIITIKRITDTTGVDASDISAMGFGATVVAPAITLAASDTLVTTTAVASFGNGTWAGTQPSGFAYSAGESQFAVNFSMEIAHAEDVLPSGSTGTLTWTMPQDAAEVAYAIGWLSVGGGGGDTNARLIGGDLLQSNLFGRLVA